VSVRVRDPELVLIARESGPPVETYGAGRRCAECGCKVSQYTPPIADGVSACCLHEAVVTERVGAVGLAEPEQTKVCVICEKELPYSAFGVRRVHSTGRASRCRECDRAETRYRKYGRRRYATAEERAESHRRARKTRERKLAEALADGRAKECVSCHVTKPVEAFYENRSRGTRFARCRVCERAVQREAWRALPDDERDRRNRDRYRRKVEARGGLLPPEEAKRRRLEGLRRANERKRAERLAHEEGVAA
jgi:hypothetical protein